MHTIRTVRVLSNHAFRAADIVLLDILALDRRSNCDVDNGKYTMDLWSCLDGSRSSCQLAGTVSGLTAVHKPVRPVAWCRGEKQKSVEFEEVEETELKGVEEDDD